MEAQQMPYLPLPKHGRTLSVKMLWAWLHHLGSIVGTQIIPKRNYDQYSCGGPYYNYIEHIEAFRPMYKGAWICICEIYAQSSC